jgi:uncharacterized protein (DUF2141 family)
MNIRLGLLALLVTPLSAADLIVVIKGARPSTGTINCGVFRTADGFPENFLKAAQTIFLKPGEPAECRFTNLAPGQFAVAIAADANGNRKLDKNMLGIPKEAWGVSGNIRPGLRAPRFEEAVGELKGVDLRIEVNLAK